MAKARYLPIVAIVVIILLFVLVGGGIAILLNRNSGGVVISSDPNKFKSCTDLALWLNRSKQKSIPRYERYEDGIFNIPMPSVAPSFSVGTDTAAGSSANYSSTNVQVAGVDEADIIKTDGNFIYLVSDKSIKIVAVSNGKFSPQSTIRLASTPAEIFVQDSKLVIYATSTRNFAEQGSPTTGRTTDFAPDYYYGGQQVVDIYVYNIADRKLPKFERKVSMEGSYLTSRLIGGTAYLVANFYSNLADADIDKDNATNFLPQLSDTTTDGAVEFRPIVGCEDLRYVGNYTNQFVAMLAIPLSGDAIGKEVMLSAAQNVYASTQSLYSVNTDYAVNRNFTCDPVDRLFVPDMCQPTSSNAEAKTNIYKFNLDGTNIKYQTSAVVQGQVLNQFSMDEFEGHFRIATTSGEVWNERQPSQSSLYILNDKLEQTGVVNGLGKGEKIYSVRFMGKRAYIVTFKKVDPFYVLDVSNPADPKVLGELKIPGYSDYLHPFDENHIIGVGKNATDSAQGSFAWYQGLKMALFDVTDPTSPKQIQQIEIGDRVSESEVLSNHKAFLFDKTKELLVLPASIATISNKTVERDFPQYGTVNFRGFLVYKLTLNGFVERGRIASGNATNNYWWGTNGSRSLYIGDYLITFADGSLQSHNLQSMAKVDNLKLN
jgi:uncharacterized secreted protein with C-terminal beta-propeller domain